MKLQSINEEHEILIRRYVNFIKGVAYEATEDCEYGKFEDYNNILNNIIKYTNEFQDIIENNYQTKEWVFMSPNLMLYSCMGFLNGIKNKDNNDKIEHLSEILFEKTIEVVERTATIVENIEYEQSKKEKIELIKIKRNEHSN
jgi:hypothetical protein|tara:strand:+ start:2577 stop:3005 length:429 start_codon:yes stop_codon:yes gene_type:complete